MKKPTEHSASPDADLFRQAIEGVTPIAHPDRISPLRPTPPISKVHSAHTLSAVADTWSDHHAHEIAVTSFLRTGMNNMTLRKLRRGHWPVQANIDLHGLTSDEARIVLLNFMNHALSCDYRCIHVIHGKGWRSEGGEGILKIRVRHWLTQHPKVLAFCEAPAHAGGGGAVWILLKSIN